MNPSFQRNGMNMKYIIELIDGVSGHKIGFVGNGKYSIMQRKYVNIVDQDDAKRYTSMKRAENAYDKMKMTFENVAMSTSCNIVEVDDHGD